MTRQVPHSLRVATWNTEQWLSDNLPDKHRSSYNRIANEIYRAAAAIIVLPEAASGDGASVDDAARLAERTSYKYYSSVEYEDPQLDNPVWLTVLSRYAMKFTTVRVGDEDCARNIIVGDFSPTALGDTRLIAAHLSDRSESERLSQVRDIVGIIADARSNQREVILAGDLNAMRPDSSLWQRAPARSADIVSRLPLTEGMRSICRRLGDMATGEVMGELISAGLIDANVDNRGTVTPKMRGLLYLPSTPLVAIDHIMHSPGLASYDFHRAHDGGADHRLIYTNIVKQPRS